MSSFLMIYGRFISCLDVVVDIALQDVSLC